jgi:rfaE bifunctional protein kinase chain/domain
MKRIQMADSRARLARLVKSLRGQRMVVVGDWMLDRYVWGTASRLSPEAAVPVVDFAQQSECLGGAGNVAANLVSLGARVTPIGILGQDEPGRALLACLRALQLSEKGLVADASRPTTVKTRIIARHQQVVRVDTETRAAISGELEERLIRRVIAALRGSDALIVSDYDKGAITDAVAERVLGACQRLKVPAFVKPKWSRLPTYRGATAIVCNRAEASFLVTHALDSDESIEEAGGRLLAHFGCPAVVITRGEQGLSVFEHDAPRGFHVAATSRELPYGTLGQPSAGRKLAGRQVFDVTGAGDTVLATLGLAVAAGASMRDAAVLANAAAGVVVGKLGTASVSPAELLAALREIA